MPLHLFTASSATLPTYTQSPPWHPQFQPYSSDCHIRQSFLKNETLLKQKLFRAIPDIHWGSDTFALNNCSPSSKPFHGLSYLVSNIFFKILRLQFQPFYFPASTSSCFHIMRLCSHWKCSEQQMTAFHLSHVAIRLQFASQKMSAHLVYHTHWTYAFVVFSPGWLEKPRGKDRGQL